MNNMAAEATKVITIENNDFRPLTMWLAARKK